MHGWPELVMKTGRVYTISDNEGIRHWLPKKADVNIFTVTMICSLLWTGRMYYRTRAMLTWPSPAESYPV